MFSVSVCFGPNASVWAFLFKTEESLETAITNFPSTPSICDDFGQVATFDKVHGYIIENMSLSKLAHQERALHEGRLRANVQRAAQSDPQLREAMRPAGPGIVSPFGVGAR